jgi:hypothetical protein
MGCDGGAYAWVQAELHAAVLEDQPLACAFTSRTFVRTNPKVHSQESEPITAIPPFREWTKIEVVEQSGEAGPEARWLLQLRWLPFSMAKASRVYAFVRGVAEAPPLLGAKGGNVAVVCRVHDPFDPTTFGAHGEKQRAPPEIPACWHEAIGLL